MFEAADVRFDLHNNYAFSTLDPEVLADHVVEGITQVIAITLGTTGNEIANVHMVLHLLIDLVYLIQANFTHFKSTSK
jgi:hypothetical protein